ncbi:UNVERIFIED_CONTAM: hypothetical protein RMT77_006190 [Armadillidium vulgare]
MRRMTKKFITFTLFLLLIYIIDWSAMLKLAVTFYEGTTKNSSELQNGENILVNRIYPDFHQCSNKESSKRFEQKGQFWVINNYIKASKEFNCDETITYTTHGEYYFLDNLVFLTERWQGPISVAVYAPGADFDEAVKTIIHLRNCVSKNVKDFVTFHLYFEAEHFPTNISETSDFLINCSESYHFNESKTSYRKTNSLLYPVNVGRNIARMNAATYFVFASDIELYPSINVIPEFLKMIEKSDYTDSLNKRVFVLPIFEVKKDQKVPKKKNELLSMLRKKDAIWFHAKRCKACHLPPGSEEWKKSERNSGLSVMKIGSRTESFRSWEPFYIGTNDEPIFDERLSSEGRANKMTQAYAMCLLGYEYHVLDNAFLVHKPGIKLLAKKYIYSNLVRKQNALIHSKIVKEYKKYYGDRKECKVM